MRASSEDVRRKTVQTIEREIFQVASRQAFRMSFASAKAYVVKSRSFCNFLQEETLLSALH